MPRIAWLTDLHLNFVEPDARFVFYESLRQQAVEALLVTGDVGEAESVVSLLRELDDHVQQTIYFVLGNHDFYFGGIHSVRQQVAQLCRDRSKLQYLSTAGPIELAPHLGLVGHDGWADGRIGDYERSYVMMNDYRLIRELADYDKRSRWPQLMALGDEAAAHLRHVLPEALDHYPHVLLATHVPPWREACWYEGQLSDDEWAPHFTCQATGEAILEVMQGYPQRNLTVLCGHTHSAGEAQLAENVRVWTGGAVYGRPEVCRLLSLEDSAWKSR